MSLYAITREAGPGWTDGKGAFDQAGASDHAAFMGGLAEQGFAVLAGPLAGTEAGRIRVLLVVEADSEADVRRRLAEDPWELGRLIVTTVVEPWTLLMGAERMEALSTT
jgi:uncharacterized protein YciI